MVAFCKQKKFSHYATKGKDKSFVQDRQGNGRIFFEGKGKAKRKTRRTEGLSDCLHVCKTVGLLDFYPLGAFLDFDYAQSAG